MATVGQIIFRIMIAIIVILVAAIGLIIGIGVSGQDSSTVSTENAVGHIGKSVILSCTFPPDVKVSPDILWEKEGTSGYIYKYENGKQVLSGQNEQFKGRVSIFLNQLVSGNASLSLSDLSLSDQGTYKCIVSNSNGKGESKLTLKVGGFSPLTITRLSLNTLSCSSPLWYPQPTVTWLNGTVNLANFSSTIFIPSLDNMIEVNSSLTDVQQNLQYTCVIANELAKAEGDAIWTVSGLNTHSSLDIISSADALRPPLYSLCGLCVMLWVGSDRL